MPTSPSPCLGLPTDQIHKPDIFVKDAAGSFNIHLQGTSSKKIDNSTAEGIINTTYGSIYYACSGNSGSGS